MQPGYQWSNNHPSHWKLIPEICNLLTWRNILNSPFRNKKNKVVYNFGCKYLQMISTYRQLKIQPVCNGYRLKHPINTVFKQVAEIIGCQFGYLWYSQEIESACLTDRSTQKSKKLIKIHISKCSTVSSLHAPKQTRWPFKLNNCSQWTISASRGCHQLFYPITRQLINS